MAIPCENPQEPDSSPIPSKPEVMRKVEWDRIGAVRSESREAPEKLVSGRLSQDLYIYRKIDEIPSLLSARGVPLPAAMASSLDDQQKGQ